MPYERPYVSAYRPAYISSVGLEIYRYYVDSNAPVIGNGTRAAPFKYPSDLPALAAGDTVGLRRGSVWHAEGFYAPSLDGVVFGAYGAGPRPKIIGSAVAENANFSKTDGQTNVYQVDVTLPGGSGNWVNVFEDDDFLVAAADLSGCDSTAGSYYLADHNAESATLYVHPTGSTDPTSDGKLYEHSAYAYGIHLTGDSCAIIGIEVGRQTQEGGAVKLGSNGLLRDFRIYQTSRHAIVPGAGSRIQAGSFDDMYWPTYNGGGFVVFNQNVFAGETCFVDLVAFSCSAAGRCPIAVDSHHSTSGSLARIVVRNFTMTQIDTGVGCNDVDFLEVSDGVLTDVVTPFTPFGPAGIISNVVHTNSLSGVTQRFAVFGNDGQAFSLTGNQSDMAEGSGFVRSTGTGNDIDLDGNTCHLGTWGGFPIEMVRVNSGSLRQYNNDFDDDNGQYALVTGAGVSLDSDYNAFSPSTYTWVIDGNAYNFSEYKTATGQDAHSTAS